MSVAVIAFRVTPKAINATSAAGRRVALARRSPAMAPGHPAYLRFAHRALEPVAAPFFHQNHLDNAKQDRFNGGKLLGEMGGRTRVICVEDLADGQWLN